MTCQDLFRTLFFTLLISGPSGFAQISGDLVILSPRVGEYIDAAESEFFHVFQSVKGLHRAHVVVTRDSLLYVVFEIEIPPMPQTIEYVQYSLTLLNVIAEKIEHIEGLTDGTYVMGTQPAALRTIHGTRPAVRVPTPAVGRPDPVAERSKRLTMDDVLPLAGPSVPMTTRYPRFSLAAGISTFRADFTELHTLLASVEDYYRQTGYPIDQQVPDDSPRVVLLCSVNAVLSPSWETGLDVSYQAGFLTIKSAGICARYFPELLAFVDGVRGFLTGGMQYNSYTLSSKMDYKDRIGPDDSQGRYMILAWVTIGGSEEQIAPLVGAGIEFGHQKGNPLGLTVSAKYLVAPPLVVSSRVGSCQIKTSSWILGAALTLYF